MVTTAEQMLFWRYIASTIDQLIAVAEELDGDGLNWTPPATGANSVCALATHVLGNARENLIEVLCGLPFGRARQAEFESTCDSPAVLRGRWLALRAEVQEQFSKITQADLDRRLVHPRRGEITGREVLIVVARHAAEHRGQAELTRDLYLASLRPSQDG
jgi:uncharacterized damage-inducible protein DinB